MVKTPWSDSAIPFHEAAGIGTEKVIRNILPLVLVVTTDGSFGEIPRENFLEAEEKTVKELKKQGKPFLILLNSQFPHKEETRKLAEDIRAKYGVSVVPVNCEQLRNEDITRILEQILYEFPLSEIRFYIPKWMEMLPADHELKTQILEQIRNLMKSLVHIKDVTKDSVKIRKPLCTGHTS